MAVWSPAGASISFMFLFLQNTSNSRALNAWAWSHLIDRGMSWNWQCSDKQFKAVSETQFLRTSA